MNVDQSNITLFILAQLFGLIGCYISYVRMQQDNWRSLHLYHTLLCIPMGIHYLLVGAVFAASLCAVGALRTFLLSTNWGDSRKITIVVCCLAFPAMATFWTATHWLDWLLLITTIIGVGVEAQSCMLRLRVCTLLNASVWMVNGLYFGALTGALLSVSCIISNAKAMNRQYGISFIPRTRLMRARVRPVVATPRTYP